MKTWHVQARQAKKILTTGVAWAVLLPAGALEAQAVFRSPQSANLPTAAMLNGGNWQFEISHRFGRISGGAGDLWGIDGPVINRLGLTWAAHDRVMLGVLRSNRDDNLELNAKAGLLATASESLPVEVAAMGGVAWNTAVTTVAGFPGLEDDEMQAYVQLVANVLVGEQVALGVVPTLLHNPRLEDVDAESTFVVGANGQVYLNDTWSFLAEWIFSEERQGVAYDSGTFGFEIRTRGHFFKLLVSNQWRLNPTQSLAGSDGDFGDTDDWRFGFNLTRLLPF